MNNYNKVQERRNTKDYIFSTYVERENNSYKNWSKVILQKYVDNLKALSNEQSKFTIKVLFGVDPDTNFPLVISLLTQILNLLKQNNGDNKAIKAYKNLIAQYQKSSNYHLNS